MTSNADNGVGSLREAIQLANASPNFDRIHFNIPSYMGYGIQPSTRSLDPITNPVLIDGYTQPGSRPSSSPGSFVDTQIRVSLDGSLLGTPSNGLTVAGPGVTITGLAIVNFQGAGIALDGATDTSIHSNFIGVDMGGWEAGPNGSSGVVVSGSAKAKIAYNLISGNQLHGVELREGSTDSTVYSNIIGADRYGDSPLGNKSSGIVLDGVTSIRVFDNAISANADSGIAITGGASGNTIQGNLIGHSGFPGAMSNGGDGITIGQGASSNLIGDASHSRGNRIAANAGSGVRIDAGSGSVGNSILGNSIFNNGGLGIEITPDIGAVPVITTAYAVGRTTLLEGTIPNTQQGASYRIEFFLDSSHSSYGRDFFASITVVGQAGSTNFSSEVPNAFGPGSFITATSTSEADGTTSEFSARVEGISVDPLIVTNTGDGGVGSLRYAIEYANQNPGSDTITFNIPADPLNLTPLVIRPFTPLPVVQDERDSTTIDATTQPGYAANSSQAGFNARIPVVISGENLASPADGLVLGDGVTVRGLSIVGFKGAGLRIQGDGAFVTEMLLGLSPDGSAVANGSGVIITGDNARLGFGAYETRNVISGNAAEGVLIQGAQAFVGNNLIGIGFDGQPSRTNGTSGIAIRADRARIWQNNVIAAPNGNGVRILGGSGNLVEGNSFIGSSASGIRLDPGANGDQVAPQIVLATPDRVYGQLAGAPNTRYWLQFYRNNDRSVGLPQGQRFFAQIEVTTGPDGFARFSTYELTNWPLFLGEGITATATDIALGNTSSSSNLAHVVAPFVVETANDGGIGSLRWAMENANFIPGFDRIVFAIPGAGPHTISLASPLPAITDPVEIDGSSQPGFAGTPIVALDGSRVDPTAFGAANGFVVDSGGSTIRSLAIGNFRGYGVALRGNGGSRILGSFIGTDPSGLQRRPNLLGGVSINDSASNLIEGNLISGNGTGSGGSGVDVRGGAAVNNGIRGNTIGLARDGETALGNGTFGVFVGLGAGRTLIDSNAISGNGTAPWGAGVYLTGRDEAGRPLPSAAGEHQVINNRIGTNAAGTRGAVGSAYGVVIDDLPHNFVSNNTISGNAVAGLLISNWRARGNVATFNRIGTDATARYAIPNGATDSGRNAGDGVVLADAAENRIGGNGQGNIIAGNARYGIYLLGSGSESNQVGLNLFGRGADGARIPNGGGDIARLKSTPSGPWIVVDRAPIPPRVPVPRPQPPRRPPAMQPPRTLREGQLPAGRPLGRS